MHCLIPTTQQIRSVRVSCVVLFINMCFYSSPLAEKGHR